MTQPAGPVDKRRRKRGLTIAIRTAIDEMIYDRRSRAEACEKAGITERALYLGLEKAEVAAYWNKAIVVLRAGERAQNFHRLTNIRDQDENRAAAVKAVQLMEALDAEAIARPSTGAKPGVTIRIINVPAVQAAPMRTIELRPTDPDELDDSNRGSISHSRHEPPSEKR